MEKILSDIPTASYGSLIFDAAGDLYGTSTGGGGNGYVFELTPNGDGTWALSLLHSFFKNGTDGLHPYGSLILDAAGNLYGTTALGGSGACAGDGCGTVFELTPAGGGNWTETILHSFVGANDGNQPTGNPYIDATGRLYGMTQTGGKSNLGIVYRITP